MKGKKVFIIFAAASMVLVGTVMLCANLFRWPMSLFDGWWTLLLMAAALSSMASNGVRFGNAMLMGTALLLLARTRGFIIESWAQFGGCVAAYALILLGITLIAGLLRPHKPAKPAASAAPQVPPVPPPGSSNPFSGYATGEDYPLRTAVFSSEQLLSACKNLRGGRFTALFGSVTADLRSADFTYPISMEVWSLFGGVDLYAPPNVQVVCSGNSVFGECNCKAAALRPYDPAHPTLTVKYFNLFGSTKVV